NILFRLPKRADTAARLQEKLQQLNCQINLDASASTLEVADQQMVEILRGLMREARILILDEPTEGIQPSVIKEIGGVIRQLASRGDMAILLVEQFYDFAAGLADHYLVMSRGAIVQQGKGGDMESDGVRATSPG
ncbi:ATP-binding cassette domain-containing protein, partial [Enterobacter hormaechei]|uniref:ATP-binding cassette domain-containing protein n=1 Tax=Enterobacter hormaechei TaxID=158836 RepID=UPI0034D784FA